jgi:hypothetical protein
MDSKPPPTAGVTLLRDIAVGNIIRRRGDKGTAYVVILAYQKCQVEW